MIWNEGSQLSKNETQIVDNLIVDLDLSVFHDGYKKRIEAMIKSRMKGEVAQVEEKKRKKPVAKSMMEELRVTTESLNLPKTS